MYGSLETYLSLYIMPYMYLYTHLPSRAVGAINTLSTSLRTHNA